MKKIIIILLIPLLISSININSRKDDMLRIRVIANSNSEHDVQIKNEISNNLKINLYNLLKDENNIDNARKIINNNIDILSENIEKSLVNEDYSYNINYGLNYFPEKKYKGKTYKEGKYESLLVTLGKGEGNNWWCILFPPLCLVEAEESEEEVEYGFFLKNIIDKIFN